MTVPREIWVNAKASRGREKFGPFAAPLSVCPSSDTELSVGTGFSSYTLFKNDSSRLGGSLAAMCGSGFFQNGSVKFTAPYSERIALTGLGTPNPYSGQSHICV